MLAMGPLVKPASDLWPSDKNKSAAARRRRRRSTGLAVPVAPPLAAVVAAAAPEQNRHAGIIYMINPERTIQNAKIVRKNNKIKRNGHHYGNLFHRYYCHWVFLSCFGIPAGYIER